MTMALSLALFVLSSLCFQSKNPLKMSVWLLMYSMFLFSLVYIKTGSSWFPTLFFLLFMGGILMMFMILSSILPNEKPKKFKEIYMINLIFIFLMSFSWKITLIPEMYSYLKSCISQGVTIELAMSLLALYFFLSIFMTSSSENSMRTFSC